MRLATVKSLRHTIETSDQWPAFNRSQTKLTNDSAKNNVRAVGKSFSRSTSLESSATKNKRNKKLRGGSPGTDPIKILQCKFYAAHFFQDFDWLKLFRILDA